ncbi:MAG: VOC family protein [Aggregatilineales bacterium]
MIPPTINQQITFLYTTDLDRSATFYEDVLGLSLWLDQGTCRIYHTTSNAYIGICQTGDSSKGKVQAGEQTNIIFTIVTEEVDAWYDYLMGKGVQFEKPPETNPTYNIYHCFLRDPNGYLIEIQHFLNE